MLLESDPDLPLIRRIARNDHDALEMLYQRHGLALLNFLIAKLGDRTMAEDALQNTMLAVWQGSAKFRADSQVRTWLFAIARRQTGKVSHEFASSIALEAIVALEAGTPHDDVPDVQPLQGALRRLSLVEKEALELVYYRGMTVPEAAAHLQIAQNTVKSRLIRARTNLRRWLIGTEVDRA